MTIGYSRPPDMLEHAILSGAAQIGTYRYRLSAAMLNQQLACLRCTISGQIADRCAGDYCLIATSYA
jgi:hypothetical protein